MGSAQAWRETDVTTDELQTEQDEVARDDAPASEEPVDKTVISSTTAIPADERHQLKEEPFEVPEVTPMPTWALGVMFAAAAAIVAAIAIAFLTPPTLALDRVVMDFDAAELEGAELTDSVYAINDGYKLVGEQASGIEDNGTGHKVAYIDAAFENESFSVVMGIEQSYELVGREWVARDYRITHVDALPIAPVDADLVLSDIEKVFTKVAPYRGSRIEEVYAGGEFEVVENALDKDDDGSIICRTTIAMHRTLDLSQYDGEVTVTFRFYPGAASSDAGTWRLISADASEESWTPSLAPIKGTWLGVLESTTNTNLIFDTGRCMAGLSAGFTLEVTEYNQSSGRMTANITFVAHNHAGISEDSEGTDGDVVVTLEGQVVNLDPNTLEGSLVPLESGGDQGAFQIDFYNDDGVWEAQVTSGVAGSDSIFALGMTEFVDVYVLERG